MMRMMFLLCLMIASASAQAATYELSLPGFPAADQAECQDKASAAASDMVRATNVVLLGARCEREDYTRGGYEVTIHYNATRALSTGTKVQDPLYGSYGSGELCNADLARQVQLFTRQTGLAPVLQYCSPEGYLYLQSFATSAVKPYWFSSGLLGPYSIFDVLVDDSDALIAAIRAGLSRHVQALATVRLSGSQLHVLYYDRQHKSLEFVADFGFANEQDCERQKPQFRDLITMFHGQTVADFCFATEFFPQPEAQLISLVLSNTSVFYGQIENLYKYEDLTTYESLARCEDDKSRRISFYRSQNWQVYAGICSMVEDTNRYMLNLYRRES